MNADKANGRAFHEMLQLPTKIGMILNSSFRYVSQQQYQAFRTFAGFRVESVQKRESVQNIRQGRLCQQHQKGDLKAAQILSLLLILIYAVILSHFEKIQFEPAAITYRLNHPSKGIYNSFS